MKKLISYLLVLTLTVTLFPTFASASSANSKEYSETEIMNLSYYAGGILHAEIYQNLYFPETFDLRKAYVWPDEEEGIFFYFDYVAENRMGGRTPKEVYAIAYRDEGSIFDYKYACYYEGKESFFNTDLQVKILQYLGNMDEYSERAVQLDKEIILYTIDALNAY